MFLLRSPVVCVGDPWVVKKPYAPENMKFHYIYCSIKPKPLRVALLVFTGVSDSLEQVL